MKATTCRNLRHCRANSDLHVIVRIALSYLHHQVTVRIATARLQGYLHVTVRISLSYLHGQITVRIAKVRLQGYLHVTVRIEYRISARDRANSICLKIFGQDFDRGHRVVGVVHGRLRRFSKLFATDDLK